jgi:hypothetical protein
MAQRILLFFTLFILTSCGGRHFKPDVTKKSSKEVKRVIPRLKIFIEDGGSMKGFFIDPHYSFSSDLSTLFTNLNSKSKELNLISNDKIKPLNFGKSELKFSSFLSNLNKQGRYKGESSFEQMLPIVLNNIDKNTVTAFVSDYIQSSSDLTNPIAGHYVTKILSKKAKEIKNFAICILKMKSRFNGDFFYVSEARKDLLPNPEPIDTTKPYYIWFFGDNDLIENLKLNLNNINSLSLSGFEDYSIYNQVNYDDLENKLNWTILQHTNSIGTFRPARQIQDKTSQTIKISNVKPDRINDEFQICVAIDLSKIPVSEDIKVDPDNYFLNSNGFNIQSISKLKGFNFNYFDKELTVDAKDKNTLSRINATHLIFLKSNQKVVENIEISLKRGISTVLIHSNSNDESSLGNSMTFGFKNFTDAISSCFPKYQNNSYYFTKKILIENAIGGFNWYLFFIVLITICVSVIIFIQFKKR